MRWRSPTHLRAILTGVSGADLAEVAKLIANPTCAGILDALMSDRTLTISTIALEVTRSPSTVSSAVSALAAASLVRRESVGRVTIVRIASQEVAETLELLGGLTQPATPTSLRQANKMHALRRGRTCYDHFAGQLGVELADRLLDRGVVDCAQDGSWSLSSDGRRRLIELGVDPGLIATPGRRPLIRACMDWTERRPHVAGRLGAAICTLWLGQGLVSRMPRTRAVKVTTAADDWLDQL